MKVSDDDSSSQEEQHKSTMEPVLNSIDRNECLITAGSDVASDRLLLPFQSMRTETSNSSSQQLLNDAETNSTRMDVDDESDSDSDHGYDYNCDTSDFIGDDDEDENENEELPSSFVEGSTSIENKLQNHEWSFLPNMKHGRYRFGSAIHNDRIYIIGGTTRGSRSNEVHVYSPKTKSWIFTLEKMKKRRTNCSCAVVGDDIYVLGGLTDGNKSAASCIEIFNVTELAWRDCEFPMPTPRERHNSVAIGKKIYVFGGFRCEGSTDVFDTETGEWRQLPSMNKSKYSFAAVVFDEKIYSIGGMIEFPPGTKKNKNNRYARVLETMEIFDVSNETWTISSHTMQNRRSGCSAVTIGREIIVFGGCDEQSSVDAVESFDVSNQQWRGSILPPSKVKRRDFVAMVRCKDLVVIGGIDSTRGAFTIARSSYCLDSVEIFGNAVTLALEASKSDMSIPNDNKKTNIDHQSKAKNTTCIKSSKAIATKHRKAQPPPRHKNRCSPRKRYCQQAPKKMKPQPLLTQYANRRVAKRFKSGIFFGTVSPKVSGTSLLVTVEYDDDDREELDVQELEDALKLYEKEKKKEKDNRHDRRTKNKKRTEKAKKTARKKRGSVVTPLKQGPKLLDSRLQSLNQRLNKRMKRAKNLEGKVFGISKEDDDPKKKTSLSLHISRLEDYFDIPMDQRSVSVKERLDQVNEALEGKKEEVSELEQSVFGIVNHNDSDSIQDRVSKLEGCLLGGVKSIRRKELDAFVIC